MTAAEFELALAGLCSRRYRVRYFGRSWSIEDCVQLAAIRAVELFRAGEFASEAELSEWFGKQVSKQAYLQRMSDTRKKRGGSAAAMDLDYSYASSQDASQDVLEAIGEVLGLESLQVAEALASGSTVREAAELAGLSESQAHRRIAKMRAVAA